MQPVASDVFAYAARHETTDVNDVNDGDDDDDCNNYHSSVSTCNYRAKPCMY